MARRANNKDTLSSGNTVQVVLASATALLVGYLMTYPTKEETKTEYPAVNKDKTLIWREDRGISKLVPLHPRGADDPTILKKYTMAEVAKRDSPAEAWIVIDERVYDITNFVAKHPGGEKVLYNMAGKDCTDAFANYHSAAIYKKWLPPYLIGQVTDVPVYPHVQDFRDIRQELMRRGLFETNPVYYYKLYAWFATLFVSSLYLTLQCQSTAAHMLGATLMGMFWQQLAGWGHDIGHSSISHNFQYDNLVGSTIGSAVLGISVGWWKRSHNTHHVVCNSIENDPDIQHMPFMAVTPEIMKEPFWSSYHDKVIFVDAAARFFIRHQHWFFLAIMAAGRFNLYAQSWILLLTTINRKDAIVMYYRVHEMISLTFFALWVIAVVCSLPTWLEAAGWIIISHGVSGLLHLQITLSHFSMDTYHGNAYNDASDEWYTMQIKTTLNVDCYDWMDWFHVGLQYQIEHHLYPTLPRHNLPIAKQMVEQVCKKHGIQYNETTFFQGVIKTILCLRETAMEARKGKFDYRTSTSHIRDLLNANG
ncbi:Bifunctional delta 6-fatty acyl acetylenase/desaturase [Seminavis robusta]|uniref:Bifunctional delta 6-fatty acyl acetylenase/desaturase n=1 Tax=Seminavis robusta TaxID=568900 RepID=A0A9N8HNN7_9STRA|nr:Bifunctional delta 6-fatty acyl acetylenase/desaturase [Seminavis robusta]|eukprot:Sro1002_g229880.1 Bifunctional delta 6-fatty acyl acetylenase/desaturase (534) ;mRNA; r:21432-23033